MPVRSSAEELSALFIGLPAGVSHLLLDYEPATGEGWMADVANQEPLRLECQHFLDCLDRRTRPRSDGWNGVSGWPPGQYRRLDERSILATATRLPTARGTLTARPAPRRSYA